jgi:hypothetical protein
MTPELQAALVPIIVGTIINAAVTWGIISTKLAWMRRDIDDLMRWRENVIEREARA